MWTLGEGDPAGIIGNMAQSEFNDFVQSMRLVFFILLPGILTGLIISVLDFFQYHFLKDRFSLQKLVVGVIGDLILSAFIGAVCYELKISTACSMAMCGLGVRRGGVWVDKVIDKYIISKSGDNDEIPNPHHTLHTK